MKGISYLLEYLLLKGSLSLAGKVSRERAFKFSDRLADVLYNYPRIKRVTEENLQFTGFPSETGKRSLRNFLHCSVDFLLSGNCKFEYLQTLFEPFDFSVIPKGGGIFLTAHIGNWELMGAFYSILSGGNLSVVAKPMKNWRVNNFINSIRQKWKMKVIPTGRVIEIVKDLKRGRHVAILLDQRPKVKEGVLTSFLGRDTYTNRGAALLSIKTRKPIIPAFCFVEGNRYVIEVGKPIQPAGKSVEELTQECTKVIEMAVKKHPEQWFWFHRRWKNSPEFKRWKEKSH